VRRAWKAAGKGGAREGTVDFVITTVGEYLIICFEYCIVLMCDLGGDSFSPTKGLYLDPPDLCTRALRALLSALPDHLRQPGSRPRIVALSSTGISEVGHAALPIVKRLTYPSLLAAPHRDMLCLELVLAHVSGHDGDWLPLTSRAEAGILPGGWENLTGLPGAGQLPDAVLIRPAWLTDGPAKGEYRVLEGQGDRDCKTISREDVAHFITEQIVPQWKEWNGKAVSIGY
jgi:hypothetical protein